MSNIEKISVALPAETLELLDAAVRSGEYASTGEIIRVAIDEWTHKRDVQDKAVARLRGLVIEAENDPRPSLSEDEMDSVFDELEGELQALIDAPDAQSGAPVANKVA
jgi:antitoxin ParD1/3/4